MRVSVFGNPDLPADALPVALIPELTKRFPEIEFVHQDPNEECAPLGNPWWIIDMVKGIKEVKIITDADLIRVKRRLSLHDYDLGMHLTLLKKINPNLQIRIIGIPFGSKKETIFPTIVTILSSAPQESEKRSSCTDHTHE